MPQTASGDGAQTASGDGAQTASGVGAQTASGDAGDVAQTASGDAGDVAQTASGDAGDVAQTASGVDIVNLPKGGGASKVLPDKLEKLLVNYINTMYEIFLPRSKSRVAEDLQRYIRAHNDLIVKYMTDDKPGKVNLLFVLYSDDLQH